MYRTGTGPVVTQITQPSDTGQTGTGTHRRRTADTSTPSKQRDRRTRGHTHHSHHSPLRLPTLTHTHERLNRPLTGPPSPGQPGRQRNPEPQRRPHVQAGSTATGPARCAPAPCGPPFWFSFAMRFPASCVFQIMVTPGGERQRQRTAHVSGRGWSGGG